MFLLQDKETDPENMYLFHLKHVAFDAPSSNNNGTDTYEDSLGYTSFDEYPLDIYAIQKTSSSAASKIDDLEETLDSENKPTGTFTWSDASDTDKVIIDIFNDKNNLVDREVIDAGTGSYTPNVALGENYMVYATSVTSDGKQSDAVFITLAARA